MKVFVDYDNVPRADRRHGVARLLNRVLNAIGSQALQGVRAVDVRLYGGWYTGTGASRSSQQIAPEVARAFPSRVIVSDSNGQATLIVRCEFARSLLCDPANRITHTHRTRSVPTGLTCSASSTWSCVNRSACPLSSLEGFINQRICPIQGCQVEPGNVLGREEQKLVDAMLVADLAHAARQAGETIVVVSTDDDLLPGIRLALATGATIIHVHTVAGRATPHHYSHLVSGTYSQVSI